VLLLHAIQFGTQLVKNLARMQPSDLARELDKLGCNMNRPRQAGREADAGHDKPPAREMYCMIGLICKKGRAL
jgi:hypothetical protein